MTLTPAEQAELETLVSTVDAHVDENPQLYYKPNAQAEAFHRNPAVIRIIFGGNRSGKTYAIVREAAWYLTKSHPYRSIPDRPIAIRCYTTDLTRNVIDVLLPHFYAALPPDCLKRRRGQQYPGFLADKNRLCLEDGSFVQFMSYDIQGMKSEGSTWDLVLFDEPPKEEVFDANLVRIIDKKDCGGIIGAMTPIDVMPWPIRWIYERIYLRRGMEGLVEWWEFSVEGNIHNLNEELARDIMGRIPEEQRAARLYGKFQFMQGLVYKEFDANLHMVPVDREAILDRNQRGLGQILCGLDHGLRHPTACIWAYVEKGQITIFQEYRQKGLRVAENARIISDMSRDMDVAAFFADPTMWEEDAQTGERHADLYMREGLNLLPAIRDELYGISVVREYLSAAKDGQGRYLSWPKALIAEECTQLQQELETWIWMPQSTRHVQTGDAQRTVKKGEDLLDCVRYMMGMIPPDSLRLHVNPMRTDYVTGMPERLVNRALGELSALGGLHELRA